MKIYIGSELVDAPEGLEEFWKTDGTQAPEIPRSASVVAMAELQVNGFEISGVEQSVNVAAAMAMDVNVFWIFFSQSHETYIPFVQAPGYNADVTDRQPDYIEVTVTDRNNGPAAPASLSISVQKVVQ